MRTSSPGSDFRAVIYFSHISVNEIETADMKAESQQMKFESFLCLETADFTWENEVES